MTEFLRLLYALNEQMSVFEIKVLLCASAGCNDAHNGAPGHLFVCYSLCKPI